MGLPSGVQWASFNIGAERPGDLGLYFSWGNIEGHRVDENYNFSQAVYNLTPAAAIDTDLSLSQDAARANLGEPWRMPTSTEFQELIDNCTSRWDTVNGVDGILFISNVNGNALFFPAAGFFINRVLNDRYSVGYFWSSNLVSDTDAGNLRFTIQGVSPTGYSNRYIGFTVRAVMQPT